MTSLFLNIFSKPKNYIGLLIGSFLFFILLRVLPVYEIIKNSFKIPGVSIFRKFEIFFDYTLISFMDASLNEQAIVAALSILTTMNIILLIAFAQRQRKILSKRSFFASISGMFLGLFGIGCLSCGVLIMAPLLTFIGLGSYLGNFSQHALLISYIGITFVVVSIIYLLKKLSEPLVCT